jgi:hypothetical protein
MTNRSVAMTLASAGRWGSFLNGGIQTFRGLIDANGTSETQTLESSDSPIVNAFCRVAPSVRLSVLPIRDARFLWRAIVFKVRTCSAVHARRFVAFLAIVQLPVSVKGTFVAGRFFEQKYKRKI